MMYLGPTCDMLISFWLGPLCRLAYSHCRAR